MATVPRRAEIFACTGHYGHAKPGIRGVRDYTVASPYLVLLMKGAYSEGAGWPLARSRPLQRPSARSQPVLVPSAGARPSSGSRPLSQAAIGRWRFISKSCGAKPAQSLERLRDSGEATHGPLLRQVGVVVIELPESDREADLPYRGSGAISNS